jgi:hypothetical protein
MGMIGELIQTIMEFVPAWLLALVLGIGAIAVAPGWVEGLRIKRVKALLRRTVRASEAERTALIEQARMLSAGRAEVLVALIREADKLNLPVLRDQALVELKRLGTHGEVVRQLEAPADRTQDRRFGHPLEASVSIRNLVEIGAVEAARARLNEALVRFPTDPGLLTLRDELTVRAERASGG